MVDLATGTFRVPLRGSRENRRVPPSLRSSPVLVGADGHGPCNRVAGRAELRAFRSRHAPHATRHRSQNP